MTTFDNNLLFDRKGHLTDAGLFALRDGTLDELGSLEAAEHLTYCDTCLERYTLLLSAPAALQAPVHDMIPPVQNLLRMRSIRVFTNKYVSVAAAAVLAFGMWQFTLFGTTGPVEKTPAKLEKPKFSISESVGSAFHSISSSIGGLLDDVQSYAQSGFAQLSDPKSTRTKGE